ncbi:DinB family protein [Winogradskyella maritima]|uniref:DinB family protein n=1 Tax=Winogradskyella maritima TaxID=1517766 RepID=A0ABV8AFM9_9FLAO|nr:DinB family protein [Winogradskyella maritima]
MRNEELVRKWKGNKRYTLKFVDALPEEDFDFKPSSEVKSYKSQLSHITSWLRTHSRFVTDYAFPPQRAGAKAKLTSKDLIKTALEDFFDTFIEQLQQMTDEQINETVDVWYGKRTRYEIANVMDNHLSHHRGQLVVYLRLKNVKPPSYLGW